MSCESRFEDILSLERGELDAPARSELEGHLLECAVCAARLAKVRSLGSSIAKSLAEPDLAADLADSVMARIPTERTRSKRTLALVAASGLAVAACLVLFVLAKTNPAPPPVCRHATIAKEPNGTAPRAARTPQRPDRRQEETRPETRLRVAAVPQHSRPSSSGPTHRRRHTPAVRRGSTDEIAVRVEVQLDGEASRIVVAAGGAERVIEPGVRNEILPTPCDPDAQSVERPPLQTVVSASQAALMNSLM